LTPWVLESFLFCCHPPCLESPLVRTQFMKWSWFWTVTVLSFLSVGVLLAAVLPGLKPFRSDLTPAQEAAMARLSQGKDLNESMTVLVLGTDVVPSTRCDENNFCAPSNSLNGRSDTILLAHFQPQVGKANIISIPRDSRVVIPGYGKRKVNEANREGGAPLAAQTISELLGGVPIDRYVRINPLGVVDLVNSLGGVRVYLKKAIRYSDDSQHLYINLPQGWQTLSGLQTQQYLRFRHDELGDIGRVQRQQEVIRAMADKALKPETLARLPDLLEVVKRNVDTNLSVADLLTLARFALTLDRDQDLQLVMLPGRFSYPGEYGSGSYWVAATERLPALTARYLGWGELPASDPQAGYQARLAIQNASGRAVTKRQLRAYFRAQGFTNIDILDSYPDPIWRTQVIPQQGDTGLAEQVQQTLGLGEVRRDSTGQINSDITLRLGRDWGVRWDREAQPVESR